MVGVAIKADGHAIARDLRQAINHPTECPASVFALAIVGK
jgi:hypothetical protein